MLRARDIPCKLQIGYAGTVKHAWINVYIRSKGWVDKAVEFSGDSWSRMDPTFNSNSQDEETIQQYIITAFSLHVNRRHHSREGHIITLEDPLEYLHRHDKCIVSQREICTDTESYLVSLRATLRQSPDVILLGEMRDYETIQTAMTAAETGHLVLSSLHTTGAANTIGRIVDVFEPAQQRQISIQLSMVLQAVISQQLVPDVNGHTIPVFEVMRLNPAIRI